MDTLLLQQHLINTVMPSLCCKEIPPPPYKSELNDECLPRYVESSSMDLSSIMDRFAPRWDDQRVHYKVCNSDKKRSLSVDRDPTGQVLDRMEEYRHTDQEWVSLNQTRMNQVLQNMYHNHHHIPSEKQPFCLSSAAKSKYRKMALFIAKEREHIIQQMRNFRSSTSKRAHADEFDVFLSFIQDTASQSQMSNQRATIMIPTI